MVKVKVYDVGPPYPLNPTPVLYLTDEQEEMVLVLTIGIPEAYAIKSQITDEPPPQRPLTHDLLKSVFEHFDSTIEQVIITELRNQTYYVAEIHVDASGRAMTIDSRPTDAIALALRTGAPIYVADEVWYEYAREMPKQSEEDILSTEMIADKAQDAETEVKQRSAKKREETPLEAARRRLQEAIEEEKYEIAAKIRDEIRKLEQ